MFIQQSQVKASYDSVIIGGDLAALIIAKTLQDSGQRTLLIDPQAQGSANMRYLGLETAPDSEGARASLRALDNALGHEASVWRRLEDSPITYEAGFKPFVGFGDQPPEFVEELDYYLAAKSLVFAQGSFDSWLNELTERYLGDHLPGYGVHRFLTEGKQVTGLMLSNGKSVSCQSAVFCDSPQALMAALDGELIGKKVQRNLAKSPFWTSISLELVHGKAVSDSSALHVLMASKDKSDPCWGLFSAAAEGKQTSRWMSFVASEQTLDSEFLAGALKKIQKQIKRAYPEAYDGLEKEKISVHYNSHGSVDFMLTGHQCLPSLENLWVASRHVHPQKNLLGLLNQTSLVLAAMGFGENISARSPLRTELIEPSPAGP